MNTSKLRDWSLVCASFGWLVSCGHTDSGNDDPIAVTHSAVTAATSTVVTASTTPDKTISYKYTLPTSVASRAIAVLGFSEVSLADRVKITKPSGGYARVANSGTGTVQLGVTTQTGAILSAGNVFLSESAHVYGDVTLAGSFTTQSKYFVDGKVNQHVAVPTKTVTRTHGFTYASGNRNISLEPGQSLPAPLAPAMYDSLTVKQGAKVILLAGDYYFQRMQIEPGGSVIFDNSAGTTFLYAGDTFEFKGTMTPKQAGASIKLYSTFLGGGQVFVSGPFRGTIIAPNGTINLEQPGTDHHEGVFFGKTVRVAPDVVIVHKPLSSSIRSITFSKSQVCPGESVTTSVTAVDPSGSSQPPTVSINGVETSTFTDQFFGAAGPRMITVSARAADGTVESTIEQLTVLSCPAAAPVPKLVAEPDLFHPGEVTMLVGNAGLFDDGTAQYNWSFGDGTSATTSAPTVNHDYAAALSVDTLRRPFEITVTITRSGLANATGTRTFIVWNDYAVSRRRGKLEPPAEPVNPTFTIQGSAASANVKFKNLEVTALVYNQRRVDVTPCDGDSSPTLGPTETTSITVPPKGELQQNVQFASNLLTPSSCGVTVHFWGSTVAGDKAQTSVFLERPTQMNLGVPVGPQLSAMFNYLEQQKLVSNARTITEEEIARLYRARKIRYSSVTGKFYQTQTPPASTSGAQCDPDNPGTPPTGGNYSCQPTGDWSVDSPGWVAGAHIVNALKGDSVFVRSCGGHVRYIVGALHPSQMYTHTGMVTKNYVEIRQSTGEDKYLTNHPNGVLGYPTDGFQEKALRYLWPGTITSSVDEAFSAGRQLWDSDGNSYSVGGFAPEQVRCTGDAHVIYPRVAKPAPEYEATVRPRLHQAADLSKNIGGHYRFYQYSNAQDTPANDPNGPQSMPEPNSGSGFGTDNPMHGAAPTVCSSFVRFALQAAGADLDKDKTLPFKSDVTNNPPDGIFYYTPDERLDAANALYSSVYNDVQYQLDLLTETADDYWWIGAAGTVGLGLVMGPVGAGLGLVATAGMMEAGTVAKWATDAPDDVASQVTNCFASDYCSEDAKDSDNWQDPGAGFGVSPDNILDHFDAPSAVSPNGVYGYSERMKYRGKRYSQIFKWLPSAGTRQVCGTVFKGDETAKEAQVEVQGIDGASKVTDASGQFCFDAIPGGNISVHAWKTYINGDNQEQWEGKTCFVPDPASNQWILAKCADFSVANSTPTNTTNVTLNAPDAQYRMVIVEGSVSVKDADCNVDDTWGGPFTYYRTCTVGPHDGEKVAPLKEMGQRELCADEVGMKLNGTCTWQAGGKVQVDLTGQLYEAGGGTCGANDLEDTKGTTVLAPPNGKPVYFYPDGGDMYLINRGVCTLLLATWELDDEGFVHNLTATNVVAD